MQEEVNDKTIALSVKSAKLTATVSHPRFYTVIVLLRLNRQCLTWQTLHLKI